MMTSTKMPRSMGGAVEKETGPKAHPNGGAARPLPDEGGKMSRQTGGAKESGAGLEMTNGKMPRVNGAARQNAPYRS